MLAAIAAVTLPIIFDAERPPHEPGVSRRIDVMPRPDRRSVAEHEPVHVLAGLGEERAPRLAGADRRVDQAEIALVRARAEAGGPDSQLAAAALERLYVETLRYGAEAAR